MRNLGMFKKVFTKWNVLMIILAFVIGNGAHSVQSLGNTVPCAYVAGCDQYSGRKGDLTIQKWGFPATYHETSKFRISTGASSYMESVFNAQSISIVLMLVNAFFWFMLIRVLVNGIRRMAKSDSVKNAS